ncbi:hypothetical protein H2O64_04735 [Kordia sp. YSTF-M3]|uniref:PRC-barrel domain-containing protein n=1 Tax=Kordia aestuariivivens TaxID=2759037 RepID=A0ABR7Q5Y1_9FLAO|nr:hypothetical protein [Kordia aestuariivivens]MBC8753965.1 hypothetical protein [Kordia aestuariivivens]
MIGVKPKKKKEPSNQPDFNLAEGQAAIYGKVTERNVYDNSVRDAIDAQVTVFKNGVLVGYVIPFLDSSYQIVSIDAGDDYTMEFVKDSMFTTPIFSLSSKEIKEVNVELTSYDIS